MAEPIQPSGRRSEAIWPLAVYDAVDAAPDMSFPFPQREVRLLHDTDTAAATGKAVKQE